MNEQIIAIGGGGFSDPPISLALDRYILAQTDKENPRICFVPTASADDSGYVMKFYRAYSSLECIPSDLSLFESPPPNIETFLMEQDVIYVGGGNTKSMLGLWREWGLPTILRKAMANGTVLSGISAGAICWFEEGVTDSFGTRLAELECLGFLRGSLCPHYDSEKERRPTYQHLIQANQISAGYAADDGAALHFVNGELSTVVTSRLGARAYFVELQDGVVAEETLRHQLLG